MKPGKDFHLEHTSSYTPSATALRILPAEFAYHGLHIEALDFPGAFMRAPHIVHGQPEPRQTLKTPAWSNSEPTMPPGTIAIANKALQRASDAGFIWEHQWGWTELSSGLSAFIFVFPYTKKIARLLCSTDDFLVSTESMKLLSEWRQKFNEKWQVSVRSPVRQQLGMRIEIVKDQYIKISNSKRKRAQLCKASNAPIYIIPQYRHHHSSRRHF